MTRQEKVALRRIAEAIRAYAEEPGRGWSMNQVAKEWGVPTSTLDVLAGTKKRPIAESIPRGATLQLIAEKTGRSLDYLLGFDVPEMRGVSRTIAELEHDVAAYIKSKVDTGVSSSFLVDGEWVVLGERVLRFATVEALKQAGQLAGVAMDPFTLVTWRHVYAVKDADAADEPSASPPKRARRK